MKIYDDERALIKGLAANDFEATETIYRENYPAIEAFIIKNNGVHDDARDVFQEAMIILFERVQSGDFELTSLIKTYLYSVSRRIWLKKLQKLNRQYPAMENVSEIVAVEDQIESHDKVSQDLDMMQKSLEKMGEPCKSLLEAFYLQKKSMPEIAAAFGYTNADNAKNQKYKCLLRLKKIFFSQYKN
ncbi:MAG: sigma-70 family RNA polymerase sigma factor [Bacteroidetes bacterium]|nr:sigma-70 family RNA polymerase sigma factor [Bacteroidota bacterium]